MMRTYQARNLLAAEESVQDLTRQLERAKALRDGIRSRLREELLGKDFVKSGDVEVRVTENKPSLVFDFSGYRELYGIPEEMKPFVRPKKTAYTWTVRKIP